jgi:hypothetical protein
MDYSRRASHYRPHWYRLLLLLFGLALLPALGWPAASPPGAAPVTARAAPLNWHALVQVAAGRGERGPWQQNESRYDFVDDATVALDPNGEAAVAWVDQASKAVLLQRFSADGRRLLPDPVDVSRQPDTFSWLPRIALAPDAPERLFVLWQEIIFSGGSHGGDMMLARSEDGGSSFAAPLNLSNSVGGAGKGRINPEVWHNGSYDLLAGPGNVLYVVWTDYEGPLWFSRSADGGQSFTPPRRVTGGDGSAPARAPSLALGPDGTLYLAWTLGDQPAANIQLAWSADGGASFSAPLAVAPSGGYSDAPRLAVDRQGVLHLAYAEAEAGPLGLQQVRYTRSADGGRSFLPPRVISGDLPAPFVGAGYPSLQIDAAGRLFVLAELFDRAQARPHGLGLAVSANGGRDFSRLAPVPYSDDPREARNGSTQGLLMDKLAVGADGRVAVVNSAVREGSHSRVWLMRGTMAR